MIVNPEKFQAMMVDNVESIKDKYTLKIKDTDIVKKSSVTLLGNEIEKNLNFDNHISTICQKSSNTINAMSRIQKYQGLKEKQILANTIVYSNLNLSPLV